MTFLEQVAKYYVDKAQSGKIDLGQLTIVLPNRRSALFLSKYLKDSYVGVGFMPRLLTITAFTQEYCPRELATEVELLFLLYKSYCKLMPEGEAKPFDVFMRTGQTILSDFNDIDAYLADAQMLYRNIELIKDIEATYLTEDQREVARILGDKRDLSMRRDDVENFWVKAYDSKNAAKFVSLWQLMYPLYEQFNADLQELGLAYSGLQSRLAYEKCRSLGASDYGGRRFAFVGFYVLPSARLLMLKRLKDIGIADFFWDIASPLLTAAGNTAGSIVMPLSQEFKMPADFELAPIEQLPEITVYGVASSAAQAKVAAQVLSDWAPKDTDDTIGTPANGVVIPADDLLMPMLFSVPKRYVPITLAIKVPFGQTPLAQLMDSIMRAHERGRRVKGDFVFYYTDVVEILSNPYIASNLHDAAIRLKERIGKLHLYNVSSAMIAKDFEPLAFMFRYVGSQTDQRQCSRFVLDVVEQLCRLGAEPTMAHAFSEAVDSIFRLIDKHFAKGLAMTDSTFFHLTRKLVAATKLDLNGDPTWGLQLMNMPDARVLDFEQLIITSLNEGILPAKDARPSLIPPTLRRDYGLSTPEQEDNTLAYQFFRLISRARRVALIYDNRTPDLSQGEKSRFISQLELMVPERLQMRDVKLGLDPSEPRSISIPKSDAVMAELEEFLPGGQLHFSASAFKTYLSCRLKFYLQYVKRLRMDDPKLEYMDAASYGTVLHNVAERYYSKLQQSVGSGYITRQAILDKINHKAFDTELQAIALESMCENYYGRECVHSLDALPGEARINAKIMAEYVKIMLMCEAGEIFKNDNSVEFKFIAGEEKIGNEKHHVWHVNDKFDINFTLSIDRIDQLAPDQVRLIDYKTGGDSLTAPSFDKIFEDHDCGAIFQLLLYCIAYKDLQEHSEPKIKPLIYRFRDMATKGIPDIKICKASIQDYHQEIVVTEGSGKNKKEVDRFRLDVRFRERFVGILEEIFGDKQPFDQTEDTDNCRYCPFTQMCGRVDPSVDSNY